MQGDTFRAVSQFITIETSIPSFYHETRAGQFQTMRQWTREWWAAAQVRDELVTSLAVVAELEDAPEPKRTRALRLLEPLPLLQSTETVDEIDVIVASEREQQQKAAQLAQQLLLQQQQQARLEQEWRGGQRQKRVTATREREDQCQQKLTHLTSSLSNVDENF